MLSKKLKTNFKTVSAEKFDEAIQSFEKILKVRPNSRCAYLAIARNYDKANDKDLPQLKEAEKWLK